MGFQQWQPGMEFRRRMVLWWRRIFRGRGEFFGWREFGELVVVGIVA
jgi:hypothetical protein